MLKNKYKGKFVIIYGTNNMGKSAQAELLVEKLKRAGRDSIILKYPVYNLEPTGPRINEALREGLEMPSEELQREFAQNRRDFEPRLIEMLEKGVWPVAEDYKGTGIAWGVTYNIPLSVMEEINAGLLDEDLAFLLDGERFESGIERRHLHERDSNWKRARQVHLDLADRYGWEVINANQSMDGVSRDIWRIVKELL